MFDKSVEAFPSKQNNLFLAHCAISPMELQAKEAARDFLEAMAAGGISALPPYFNLLPRFHQKCAELFQTDAANISATRNTAEGMCLLANGYPFEPGDEVVSYVHEFPSNHYPWRLQERRGVKLLLLGDSDPLGSLSAVKAPRGWSMAELAEKITPRTRIVAMSHVQFTSGYAADLMELGSFCRDQDLDLVIDGAQSVGCLPLYPEEYNVAAVAVSSWKWLMGPFGAGILYTSEEFRDKIAVTMVGSSSMQQGLEYLDHSWNPHVDGRKFEYSTLAWEHLAAFNGLLDSIFLRYTMEGIREEVFELQDVFLKHLDHDLYTPLLFPERHRSGILAVLPVNSGDKLVERLAKHGIVVTGRSGYIRVAPHFYLTAADMKKAAECFNIEAQKR